MKKLKYSLFVIMIVFTAICQINRVYSYTIDEVKEKVDFKTVEEDGEPTQYDILIKAEDLITNEKLPYIETPVEDILYSDDDIFDIDFLNSNTDNTDESWKKISNLVKAIFKVTLYVSLAAMLTLLIYIAVLIVSSTIYSKNIQLPFMKILNKSISVTKGSREKVFIEQWISSVALLSVLVVIISLLTSFSNYITGITDGYKIGGEDKEDIVVYVKGSKISTFSGSGLSNTEIETNTSNETNTNNELNTNVNENSVENNGTENQNNVVPLTSGKYMFIGDSRTVGMQNQGDSNDIFIAKTSEGYNWMKDTAFSTADSQVTSGMKIIIWLGVNDPSNVDSYISAVNEKAKEWTEKGATVCFASPGPIDDGASASVSNSNLEDFNQKLSSNLSSNVQYIDVYNKLKNEGYKTVDGIHYDDETYKKVYDFLKSNSNNSSFGSGGNMMIKTIDYYFKTNLEGLLMFNSQYNWEKNAMTNFFNIFSGFIITLFKYFLYGLFIVRMLLLALITACAPIAILINAFRKISGRKGFLKKLCVLYLYLLFLKTAIQIIYYVAIKSNVKTVVEAPYYILFVIIIILVLFIISFKKLRKTLLKNA